MADATDTPPRRRSTTPPPPSSGEGGFTPASPGTPIKTLEKKLAAMIGGMALPFAAAGDIHCANLVASRAEPIAEAWANLANQSPPVRRALESMLKGGAWAGAIGTTLPVFIGVAAHHGMIPQQYANPINAMIFGAEAVKNESAPETPSSSNGTGATTFTGFPPPPDFDTPVA